MSARPSSRQPAASWRSTTLLAGLLLLPATAFAQVLTGGPWTLTASTADNGGGISTSGPWIVTGTIGQPDASPTAATAGAFAVTGGFWADAAVLPTESDGPQLTISRSGPDYVQLAWPDGSIGWTLQRSTDLITWTDIQTIASAPATGHWPLSQGPCFFFRLVLK